MLARTMLATAIAVLGLAACGTEEEQDAAREGTTVTVTTPTDTEGAAETGEDLLESVQGELEEALTRDLEEQNDSGVSGTVRLEPVSRDRIRVTIETHGGERGLSRPAHIHPGSCANLDPNPEYPLKNVVGGKSVTTIDASPLELFTGEYAVNVHESQRNPGRYVACADIPSAD